MNVLSLFDGMSCGLQALKQAGIKVDHYFASEVDKYTIQVAKKNHPEIQQLGDVKAWNTWNLPKIDLLIGGSPCQGFSFAGNQLNFDDPRSALFFEFVKIKEHFKPKYFLLENVRMKKEYQDVISGLLGVEPVLINSALVSAQNRNRLYWTNIDAGPHLEDKGILLKDIIEDGFVDREKSYCIDANYYKGGSKKNYLEKKLQRLILGKSAPFTQSELRNMVSSQLNPLLIFTEKAGDGSQSLKRMLSSTKALEEKGNCLTATVFKGMAANGVTNLIINNLFRKLTPIECERLQTLPDNYSKTGKGYSKKNHGKLIEINISNTQRYKMLGNGWTVSIIEHIFKGIK